jgi:hypothetical protein
MNLGKSAKDEESTPMSDGELAASLLDDVIGTRGVREPVKSMLERAYSLLARENGAWTRRRVRAVFNKEANRIDHREIVEMRRVVEARKRHAEYRRETAALAAMALIQPETRDRDLAAGARGRVGGMDLPGTEGR